MKYLKKFENESNIDIGTYFVISALNYKDSIKKIEKILNTKIISYLNIKTIMSRFKQDYLCVDVKNNQLGYMPLIDIEVEPHSEYYYGENYYKDVKAKFGGYINCTKNEIEDYKKYYNTLKIFNL